MSNASFKYKAFISYSHADEKIGKWIHKKIERFKVPKKLIYKKYYRDVPKRLFPVFRDREELPTASNLGEVINNALNESEFLIVICSPNSAKSLWVNEEIKYFKKLGRQKNIICLIIDGIPNKPKRLNSEIKCIECSNDLKLYPEEQELGIYFCPYCEKDVSHYKGLEECLAPELINEIKKNADIANPKSTLNSVDIRNTRDGKKKSLLKIVAFLINLPFEMLFSAVKKERRKSLCLHIILSPLILWPIFATTMFALNILGNFKPIGEIQLYYEIVGHANGKVILKETDKIRSMALKSKGLFVFDELKIGRTRKSVLSDRYITSRDLYLNEKFLYKSEYNLDNVSGWNTRISEDELNSKTYSSNYTLKSYQDTNNQITFDRNILSKKVGCYVTCRDEYKISVIKNSLPEVCFDSFDYQQGPIWISFKVLKINGNLKSDEFFSFNLLPAEYKTDNSFWDSIFLGTSLPTKNRYLSFFMGGENSSFRVDKYHKHFDDNPPSPVESIETETILTPNTFYTVVIRIDSDDFYEDLDIHSAVISGDIEHIKKCIKLTGNVNLKCLTSEYRMTPLELWFDYNYDEGIKFNYDIPKLLIQNGANPDDLLFRAADLGLEKLLKILLDNKNYIITEDNKNKINTALMYAVKSNQSDSTRLLLESGANVNNLDNKDNTPLDYAYKSNNQVTIDLLRKYGGKMSSEIPPATLIEAVRRSNLQGVKDFLAIGADVNNNSVMLLKFANTKEIAKLLIDKGADVNAVDGLFTPLHYAVSEGRKEIVELLIEEGAVVNSLTHETPLHSAVSEGRKEIVELLIEEGADLNMANQIERDSPLHYAALEGRKEIAKLLIGKGADVNYTNLIKRNPLHIAVLEGHKEIVELLIQEGADVNAVCKYGMTPINFSEIPEWPWLQTITVKNNSTKIEAAKKEIADLLRKHGAKTAEELESEVN